MSVFRKALLAAFTILFVVAIATAQKKNKQKPVDLTAARNHWVDSVYNMLNEEERIGQLFMVAAYSGTAKAYNEEYITKLINAHQVGGLIFMQGGPGRQANLTNRYQRMAQTPLLIAMDAEWGIGMRLDSVKSFPRADDARCHARYSTGVSHGRFGRQPMQTPRCSHKFRAGCGCE